MDADVIVIGGSLAGSALSLRLAQAGHSVIMIEKDGPCQRKVCGEGLSAGGVSELTQLCSIEPLRSELRPFGGYTVHRSAGHRGRTETVIPCDSSTTPRSASETESGLRESCAISRSAIAALLTEQLRGYPKFEAQYHRKVRSLEPLSDRVVARIGATEIHAPFVVLAEGAGGEIAERTGLRSRSSRPARIGGSVILEGIEREPLSTVHVFLDEPFQACLTPLPGGAANLSFFGTRDRFARPLARRSFLGPLLTRVAREVGYAGEPAGPVRGAAMLSCGRRSAIGDRLLLIGDCAEQLDPIAGMGMTHALVSARLAAACLESALQTPASWRESFRSYATCRERAVRPLRGFTALSYLNLVSGGGSRILRSLERSPLAVRLSRAVHAPTDRYSAYRFLLSTVGAFQ